MHETITYFIHLIKTCYRYEKNYYTLTKPLLA